MRLPKAEQDQTGTLDLMKVPSAPRAFETRSALSRRREGSDEKETGLLHKNAIPHQSRFSNHETRNYFADRRRLPRLIVEWEAGE